MVASRIGDSDIRLLRVFKTVVESGGLSAAEVELNIGKSTISKHVTDLELRLGLKLCTRGPAGFALTEDGAKVLQAADHLLVSVSQFRNEVNEIKEQLGGTIRISLFDQCASNPDSRLARAIHRFNEAAPSVQIELSLEPPNVIETMVISGQLDIGIIALHRPSTSLNYAPLYGENMFLYCSREHPLFEIPDRDLRTSDLLRYNYVGLSVNSPNLIVGQQLGLRRSAKVQSEQALALLILSGRYIGYLPDHLAQDFVDQKKMRVVLPDETQYRTRFAAVTRKQPEPTRVTNLFLEVLQSEHSKV
ncbi:LysR family transcriptional regulator [Ruegeria atlantica]|uniref:Ben and cat operon transcriptional regulator n=1 Tax=Ruegeria atlantica TaxID=81569 RepID=A0A0P1EDK1_9RHOB|nr:LysR family transcriptional regulator [Ruegeria atlantica]CUH47749.1 Ben and cat operon transcriptional regulator [Ruegeria atlantica]